MIVFGTALILGVLWDQLLYMGVIGLLIAFPVVLYQRRRAALHEQATPPQTTTARHATNRQEPHMPVPMTADGASADVHFDGHQVIIKRGGGFMTQIRGGLTGEKRIPVEAITSIQWQDASTLSSGFIKFLTGGSGPVQGSFGTAAVVVAINDPDAVVFKKKSQAVFVELRETVEAARLAARTPQASVAASPPADLADQLKKLGALRDTGVVSEEEFAAKKADILARM